jgi:hypothetical protein
MLVSEFKEELDRISEEDAEALDTLCVRQLRSTCQDYGKDGKVAKALLELAASLLEICF